MNQLFKYLFVGFLALSIFSCGDANKELDTPDEESERAYDPALAEKYGADEYGMKVYVMAFLKRGPNRPEDEELANELQSAHMANINRLAEEGKLVLAGPFGGDGDLRGIYVFDTPEISVAEEWTNSDPAIEYGSLVMELIPWYGSAALLALTDLHYKVSKTPI